MSEPSPEAGNAGLASAARLFGRLLVKELDAATLTELRAPEIASALQDLDIEVPTDDRLDVLGQRYFDLFLHPEGSLPPVQSLWRDGQYDGDHAIGVKKIADAANLELATGARSAAPDHIGCILLLWSELQADRADLAELLTRHHLAWAELALQHAARDDDFYGSVARATIAFVRELKPSN